MKKNVLQNKYVDFPGVYFDKGGVHWLLRDGLGSVGMTVDDSGQVEQHVQYYPYGEPHREPQGQPYLYGGKERRRFGGLNDYDFHARFLNHAAALWHAPDPRASHYPWLSPYVFCASNPIRFRDPDGKKIYIAQGLELEKVFRILLDLQRLTDDQLVFKTQKDGSRMVKIKELGTGNKVNGTKLIRMLNRHNKKITIDYKNSLGEFKDVWTYKNASMPVKETSRNIYNGEGSDSYITFNPDYVTEQSKRSGENRPSFIGLAHELIHTLHNADGDVRKPDKSNPQNNRVNYDEELRTVGILFFVTGEPTENDIREEHGLPPRDEY